MTRDSLLESAQLLQQVSKDYADEFSSKRESIVDSMNKMMSERSDIQDLIGSDDLALMKDNHANHARFMESIFHQANAEVLVDTVLWVFRAYKARNFASTYWAAQLNAWLEVYKTELSIDCQKSIYPYYNWMQINIPGFNQLADEKLELGNSAH